MLYVNKMDQLPEYPEAFETALDIVSSRKMIKLYRYEYWGVPIRQLTWLERQLLNTVQFDYRESDIGVTLKKEKTGGIYSFLRWCRNNVPMFPYLPKVIVSEQQVLPKNWSVEKYTKGVEKLVERHV